MPCHFATNEVHGQRAIKLHPEQPRETSGQLNHQHREADGRSMATQAAEVSSCVSLRQSAVAAVLATVTGGIIWLQLNVKGAHIAGQMGRKLSECQLWRSAGYVPSRWNTRISAAPTDVARNKHLTRDVASNAPSSIPATLDIYNIVLEEHPPTQTKAHYTLNMRNISKDIDGKHRTQ